MLGQLRELQRQARNPRDELVEVSFQAQAQLAVGRRVLRQLAQLDQQRVVARRRLLGDRRRARRRLAAALVPGRLVLVGGLRRSMAKAGYSELKEFQKVGLNVAY